MFLLLVRLFSLKNRIKKRRFDALDLPIDSCGSANLNGANQKSPDKSSIWYNLSSIAIIIEVLVGAILGIALCFGFFFAFFMLRGSLLVSLGIFLIILIIATFAVLVLKYIFVLVTLKLREIELLEKITRK